jgi:hypothetical protein
MNNELRTMNNQIIQNKPNLLNTQMNVNSVLTEDYENEIALSLQKNKPKQSQTNSQRNEDSTCISRPIVLYFFLYNAVDEGPLRISRPAGQPVPSVAGCKYGYWGIGG